MTHAIEVRNVYREFQQRSGMAGARRPVRAVDGVTFSLPAGDVLGVVGESGCVHPPESRPRLAAADP
jgi:peptide/nickel transport system ATP-binding protein